MRYARDWQNRPVTAMRIEQDVDGMEVVLARGPIECADRSSWEMFFSPFTTRMFFDAGTWAAILCNTVAMHRLKKISTYLDNQTVEEKSPWCDVFRALLTYKDGYENMVSSLRNTEHAIAEDLPNTTAYDARAVDAFIDWINDLFRFVE